MSAEKSKKTPDKRRKCDEAFKAEALHLASESRSTQAAAQQLGISPKLLYRWQQAKVVAEAGSVEVARDPEVRQLRTQLKRAEQELDSLKKPWSSLASLGPSEHLPLHRSASGAITRATALSGATRVRQCVLRLAATASACPEIFLASGCTRGV